MISKYVFSSSKNSMYLSEIKGAYEKAGSWPDDAVEVSEEVFFEFSQNAPDGKQRGALNGMPAWVDIPPLSEDEVKNENEAKKIGLTDLATQKITIRQTKLLMGRKLTESESTSLNSWMDYIDEVSVVDTSNPA